MTDINANKQIVVSFIDALFSKGDLTAVDQYLDPGFVDHDPPLPGASAGREGMRQAAAVFRAAFPDWRSDVEQLVAEGDLVVEVFTARYAPWRAHGRGADRTGGRAAGREHFRLAGGRIVERWGRLDELGLLRQLGLIPAS